MLDFFLDKLLVLNFNRSNCLKRLTRRSRIIHYNLSAGGKLNNNEEKYVYHWAGR